MNQNFTLIRPGSRLRFHFNPIGGEVLAVETSILTRQGWTCLDFTGTTDELDQSLDLPPDTKAIRFQFEGDGFLAISTDRGHAALIQVEHGDFDSPWANFQPVAA